MSDKSIFPNTIINMQYSNSKSIISKLTITIYDDKSCAQYIKKQKSRSKESQKKTRRERKASKQDETMFYRRPIRRERSVEMYDEDVYAEEYEVDDGLEKIDWDTLVYNTAAFHRMFSVPDTNEFLEQFTEKYPGTNEDAEFDQVNEELRLNALESPYHQEMLDLYAGIVADVREKMTASAPAVVPQYTCCVGCRHSNGRRPFHFCKRSFASNYVSDDEDDDDEDDDDDDSGHREMLGLYAEMLGDNPLPRRN
jgi:hypothetical protein